MQTICISPHNNVPHCTRKVVNLLVPTRGAMQFCNAMSSLRRNLGVVTLSSRHCAPQNVFVGAFRNFPGMRFNDVVSLITTIAAIYKIYRTTEKFRFSHGALSLRSLYVTCTTFQFWKNTCWHSHGLLKLRHILWSMYQSWSLPLLKTAGHQTQYNAGRFMKKYSKLYTVFVYPPR